MIPFETLMATLRGPAADSNTDGEASDESEMKYCKLQNHSRAHTLLILSVPLWRFFLEYFTLLYLKYLTSHSSTKGNFRIFQPHLQPSIELIARQGSACSVFIQANLSFNILSQHKLHVKLIEPLSLNY